MSKYYLIEHRVDAFETGFGIVEAIQYGGGYEEIKWTFSNMASIIYLLSDDSLDSGKNELVRISENRFLSYVEPTGLWDPPTECDLIILNENRDVLKLGKWVVRDGNNILVFNDSEFKSLYESF